MPYNDPEKQKEFQKNRVRKTRADFFEGKICVFCGSSESLELDHIDKDTKESHKIWSWSEERRLKEKAKCRILCYACHKERTRIQFTKPIVHGTMNCYRKRKCRCELCRKANAEKAARLRDKLKNNNTGDSSNG